MLTALDGFVVSIVKWQSRVDPPSCVALTLLLKQHQHNPREIKSAGSSVPSSVQDPLFSAIQVKSHITCACDVSGISTACWQCVKTHGCSKNCGCGDFQWHDNMICFCLPSPPENGNDRCREFSTMYHMSEPAYAPFSPRLLGLVSLPCSPWAGENPAYRPIRTHGHILDSRL